LNFTEYQKKASKTLLPQCRNLEYLGLGLAEEAGELCGKLKRIIRGDGKISDEILYEAGDVLWYLSQIAGLLKVDFDIIAFMNLDKLSKRKENGNICGKGDGR